MSNSMAINTTATLSVEWVDQAGNPATVDGDTSWASSDDTIATVTVDGTDSLKASVNSTSKIGPVQIQATVDADLGTGVKTITAVCDISVIAGEAFGGTITFTPPA